MTPHIESHGSYDVLSGRWKQLKGQVKEQWGKLTEDDLTQIDGKREKLFGKLQERYGWEKSRAQREVEAFLERHREH